MLQLAICDDRPEQLRAILNDAQSYFAVHPEREAEFRSFLSPLELLSWLEKNGSFDILLLDICMPGISGTDVAREIRLRQYRTEIIFLTTSDEYAVDAFALKAAHYLIKPYTAAAFREAMDRACSVFKERQARTVSFRGEGGELQMADADEILYIESRGHLLTVHLTDINGCSRILLESRRSLARVQADLELLLPGQFINPYKGFLVNQDAIRTIRTRSILLKNGTGIPIPRGMFRELQTGYMTYRFEKKTQ